MTHAFFLILALLAPNLPSVAATRDATPTTSPWAKVKAPAKGPAESIGSPTAGCIQGAQSLAPRGKGYRLARPGRRRTFGHPELVRLLKALAAETARNKEAPIWIGDLGLPRGGPTLSAHASHQSGLDADIWFARGTKIPQATSMVDKKSMVPSGAFGEAQIQLLRRLASSESLDRVLVHFLIKKELCRKFPAEDWIRKIRPWYGHDRHFHLRIRCPVGSPLCKSGEPLPAGNGCDETLEWWWSPEARQEEAKNMNRQQNPVIPVLPPACSPVLSAAVNKT